VNARSAGFLLLTDTFYPGWRCTIDGRDAAIRRANIAFRAVYVTPGRHDIVFRYRPLPWAVGLGLSIGALASITAIAAVAATRTGARRPMAA